MPETLNPADPGFAHDPYPYYARLRARGPVARVALANGTHAWLVTGYDRAREVLADPRFSNVPPPRAGRPKPDSQAQRARACLARHMLNSDAPDHLRLRRLTTAAFTPRRVDALRPRIERLTDGLVAEVSGLLAREGTADLVDSFAFPLPVLVIGEVLGVPEADRADLREWTYRVGSPSDALERGATDEAWAALHAYFTALIAHKRRSPGDDLFSALVHDASEGGLDDGELLAMAFLLLFAGYETTMNLLASASLLLLTHPGELAAAREGGEARWAAVVEETLRHASPLEGTTWRRTTEPVDLGGGAVIPAEESVLVVLAAAGRDPERFPDPDDFRPARYLADAGPAADGGAERTRGAERTAPHLAFGHGPHFCLGSRLARMEAAIALPRLFGALPGLALATEPERLPYRPGLLVRGPRELPVTPVIPAARR
ncbi:cytochrome P450 family protein [Streptomyces hesseae]|uniref:Cytochrome P450 n=1 Tax=Streptomyces hesseae TaxID=3075519 RepID=A0ABU2SHM0_9ACTN|nr:cytochrome P450 [Streptomyces sp. DSM 40473]MDT0448478.1 cytochrome P450 [Streptomyces sp. DSM 40473]